MMKDKHKRSGSALVVVLGMLAVIMLMAVAFSVYMRTERAGTTNLRHALVAKQMMQTAIARTMESIDASFGDPADNAPAPYWQEPYLTSYAPRFTDPVKVSYQSAPWSNAAQQATSARILTREMMKNLTPSQLALAKQANIGWASINAGVSSEWGRDPIVGRYAFIAFDVSGLLDVNKAGGGTPDARATDFATNAANYQIKDSLFFAPQSGADFTTDAKPDYAKTIAARKTRPFMSMADFWRRIGVAQGPDSYDWDGQDPDLPIKPDLFAPFSMSLEGLAPDGSMKLPLALQTEALKKDYAKLALPAFKKVFEEARDNKRFVFRAAGLGFTRAELATQALVDYLDDDDIPSGGIATYKADNTTIEDARGSGTGYLNFPCTEPVPMVTQAIAWFDVEKEETSVRNARNAGEPDQRKWYTEYKVKLTVVCEAQFLNDKVPANLSSKRYNLKIAFEFVDFIDMALQLWPQNGWKIANPADMQYFDSVQTAESGLKTVTPGTRQSAQILAGPLEKDVFTVRALDKVDGSGNSLGQRAFSKLEEDGSVAPTLLTEIRIKAEVFSGSTPVQQVPCPILEARSARDDYRIRVSPGVYHKKVERDVVDKGYENGWAYCVDPRFAYNTESVVDFTGSAGYRFWVDNFAAHDDLLTVNPNDPDPEKSRLNKAMIMTAQTLLDEELKGAAIIPEIGNCLIKKVYFSENDAAAVKNIADMWANAKHKPSSGTKKGSEDTSSDFIYPDSFRLAKKGGSTFMATDTYADLVLSRIANLPMVSAGELGNLLVGPWETLSLYATFKPNIPAEHRTPFVFHHALDYFSMGQARFPQIADIASTPLAGIKKRHLAAMQSGRVNLNPQRLVYPVQNEPRYGLQKLDANGYPEVNIEPLVSVLTGAGINREKGSKIDVAAAEELAALFYDEAKLRELNGEDRGALMISRLSDLGQFNAATNASPVLERLVPKNAGANPLKITCDAHREALIANTVNALTVRGQSFLVLIRAEAFSPQYGSDNPESGTTLSTTYAIVELWRDPEPARTPDGTLYRGNPADAKTPPLHSWVIRSVRWF